MPGRPRDERVLGQMGQERMDNSTCIHYIFIVNNHTNERAWGNASWQR